MSTQSNIIIAKEKGMKDTNINIRIDIATKKDAERIFDDLGMNMSKAINVFLRQCIRENGIPFMISNQSKNEKSL